ncbi:TetR/AcrR family transcriptional regulator [Pseudonocardia sp. HH130630-07]|uniref:TetR/AcrR family transcriptional regulator n=1 Tax=Pseudonocardia sp. HH130630-07 TaxID=1690815 RepID=UPI000814C50F|nr:TetR/AcrR family transcriptional regulator [Pseudonocardia sp. HH130630-07]ANY06460.1 TetR family transcriptional regulator [Pseudonocardia sp. HH130630-07]
MPRRNPSPSAREQELLELAYGHVCRYGLADVSLRPLAAAIGSSTRVLTFLFGSKDGLVRALLARARADERALLDRLRAEDPGPAGPEGVAERLWTWLSAEEHRALLRLWAESYARSLVEPDGPWAGFARAAVTDWLDLLALAQSQAERDTPAGAARRTAVLALLRGALLDLLATGDRERTTAAVVRGLRGAPAEPPDGPG